VYEAFEQDLKNEASANLNMQQSGQNDTRLYKTLKATPAQLAVQHYYAY